MQNINFDKRNIPFITQDIYIDLRGIIADTAGNYLTIEAFNALTGLEVQDAVTLRTIVFTGLRMPPVYWKHLEALPTIEGVDSPESITLALKHPIESLEMPGFFIIPYYSNYLVSRDGKLYKRSSGYLVIPSPFTTGYYTYRMKDDNDVTQNRLRHRILALTFKKYSADVDDLQVNHKNGIKGNDHLDNLEWCTPLENVHHARDLGLSEYGKAVEIMDINTLRVKRYPGYSMAARAMGITRSTMRSRVKTEGYQAFDGFQFRHYPTVEEWPIIAASDGAYKVVFPDGTSKFTTCIEAARLVGLTRTSLLRALREGRNVGANENKVYRVKS